MKSPVLCFFDVDHTITRRSTGRHFAFEAVKAGYIKARALLSIPLFYYKYRMGRISEGDLEGEFRSLKGVPRKELEELGEKTFREKIIRDIFPGARDLVADLQARGIEVVVATSSIDLIIKPLASFLGIHTVLAGSLEFNDGECTGRFKSKLYFGENKKREAFKFLTSRSIRPEDCAFYSDSIHDLPLLNAVGIPIAVNPDHRLRKHAYHSGWEIIRFR